MDVEMEDFNETYDGDPEGKEAETNFNDEKSDSTWDNFSDINYTVNDNGEKIYTFNEEKKKQYKRKKDIDYIEDLFMNILDLDKIYAFDREFINWLLDSNTLTINRDLSISGYVSDYTVRYYGGEFKSIGRVMTEEETNLLRNNIMDDYDKWRKIGNDRVMKKAGIVTAVGISIIALITGLSVGLTRKGNDMVHQSKEWKKLEPAKKVKDIIPWTDLTDAAGRSLVFTGRYLTVILVITGVYLIVWRKRTVR